MATYKYSGKQDGKATQTNMATYKFSGKQIVFNRGFHVTVDWGFILFSDL